MNEMERDKERLSDGHSVVLYEEGSDVVIILMKDGVDVATLTPQAALDLFGWLLKKVAVIEKLREKG